MTTTHTTRPFSFTHAPFVLMNADTREPLMPVHDHDPLAPIAKFNRDYPHIVLARNPLHDPSFHSCSAPDAYCRTS
jgi:hypothetical protein